MEVTCFLVVPRPALLHAFCLYPRVQNDGGWSQQGLMLLEGLLCALK